MARRSMAENNPWRRRSFFVPPNSPEALLRLALWEMWMGMLIAVLAGFGFGMILSAPDRIVTIIELSGCYAVPPLPAPCDRTIYRGGILNVAFTGLCGMLLVGVAAWLLWELWNATTPKPITDDFLRLLNDSFGRNWRNPLTWPWARVGWAFGFTTVGAVLALTIAAMTATLLAPIPKAPAPKIETSESFRSSP